MIADMKRIALTIIACLGMLSAQAQKDSTVTVVVFDAQAAQTGSLYVTSTPTKATVAVNGKEIGTTPILLKELPVGKVDILVKKKKYYEFMTRADVRQLQVGKVEVELVAHRSKRGRDKEKQEIGRTIIIGRRNRDDSFAKMPEHSETSAWNIIYESGEVFDMNNF